LTMCDNLMALKGDPVAAPAKALAGLVKERLVRWHYSQKGHHRGAGLFYKPVKPADIRRSYLQAEDVDLAAADAAHYKTLALCRATGWHRIALNPFAL
jgi:hypothetical protein